MSLKDCLTTESVKKDFKGSFDLVNYAIRLAKDMILSDRPCRVSTPIQNRAYQILLEISEKKDYFTVEVDDDSLDDQAD